MYNKKHPAIATFLFCLVLCTALLLLYRVVGPALVYTIDYSRTIYTIKYVVYIIYGIDIFELSIIIIVKCIYLIVNISCRYNNILHLPYVSAYWVLCKCSMGRTATGQ